MDAVTEPFSMAKAKEAVTKKTEKAQSLFVLGIVFFTIVVVSTVIGSHQRRVHDANIASATVCAFMNAGLMSADWSDVVYHVDSNGAVFIDGVVRGAKNDERIKDANTHEVRCGNVAK